MLREDLVLSGVLMKILKLLRMVFHTRCQLCLPGVGFASECVRGACGSPKAEFPVQPPGDAVRAHKGLPRFQSALVLIYFF